MKRRIILIIGILVALVAIWLSVRSQPLIRDAIKKNRLIQESQGKISEWFKSA